VTTTDFPPRPLPPSGGGLGGDTPPAPSGSIFVLAAGGGFAAPPRQRFELLFGRGGDDVHVVLGAGDPHVSRRHGRFVCHGTEWWLRNEGRLPIRLPRETFLLSGEEMPLAVGYSPLFIRSSARHEHLLEVRVVGGSAGSGPGGTEDDETRVPRTWELTPQERLVLTALAQSYLRQERNPQPQTWKQVAVDLAEADAAGDWNAHRAANVVGRVRDRLSETVSGLTLKEYGDAPGNAINHRLILELLQTTTLMPADLRLLNGTD
jgi:hypothetical protein